MYILGTVAGEVGLDTFCLLVVLFQDNILKKCNCSVYHGYYITPLLLSSCGNLPLIYPWFQGGSWPGEQDLHKIVSITGNSQATPEGSFELALVPQEIQKNQDEAILIM